MTNIINEGSITIYDSQTGQKQTYNLGGIKINQDVVGMNENLAYYAHIDEDNQTIFINRCIKRKESHSFTTSILDYGKDWEHSVHIPIKSKKEQLIKDLTDMFNDPFVSASVTKHDEQVFQELINAIKED